MYSKARDVDISLYNGIIYEDNLEMVIMALSMYQKPDGGFGSNLDINNYNPNSTVLSTSIALDSIYKAGIRSGFDDEYFKQMVHSAYKYLFKTAKIVDNKWNPLEETNNNYPCGNWLRYNTENIEKFSYSPTAALLGYGLVLLEETDPFYKKCLSMVECALKDYLELNKVNKYVIYSFNILKDTAKELSLYKDLTAQVEEKLFFDAKSIMCRKDEYADKFVTMPIDVFFDYTGDSEVDKIIDDNLDYLIENIPSYKLYEPNYTWGNDVPESDTALLKGFGTMTLKYINIFKKFNRLEK